MQLTNILGSMLHIGIYLSLLRSFSPEIFMSWRNLSDYKCHQNLVHSNYSFSTECYFCKELHQNSGLNTCNLSLDPDLNFTLLFIVYSILSGSISDLQQKWMIFLSKKLITYSTQCCWFWEPVFKFEFKRPILKFCPVIKLLLWVVFK